MTPRRRLDVELVRRKLVDSRAQASELIAEQKVRVGGAVATNAARLVSSSEPVEIIGPRPRFVGRGGEKLDAALERFGIDVAGRRALDVGASTGGFTDCLLQRGASSVVALDVGHGQLHERLRNDSRVEVRERSNIRHARLDDFAGLPFDLVTIDVSFISLTTIAAAVVGLTNDRADIVALVKPQFEAGRSEVSRGKGVVSGADVWHRVLFTTLSAMATAGAATIGLMVSPLVGADGNVEFLAWFSTAATPADLDALIETAVSDAVRRTS